MKLADSLELHTKKLSAGGPGSGRHPEYGKFEHVPVNDKIKRQYQTKNTAIFVYNGKEVYQQNINPTGRRLERMGQNDMRKIGQGSPEAVKSFLMSRYGIEHDIRAAGKYKVVLTREADGVSTGRLGTTNSRVVHRLDDKDEAEKRSLAMPYTKVVKRVPEEDPTIRQRIRRKKAKTNPDLE